MFHPNGWSSESHPGSNTDRKAAQWQPRCLPEAQLTALQPRGTPRFSQVSIKVELFCLWVKAYKPRFGQSPHLHPPVQPHQRMSQAGPGWQGMFQSLQAGEEAQQTTGLSRGADSGGQVSSAVGDHSSLLKCWGFFCRVDTIIKTIFLTSVIRFQEAIEKYQSVMKTEPSVVHYTNLAKERICFCLVKVSQRRIFFDMFLYWRYESF